MKKAKGNGQMKRGNGKNGKHVTKKKPPPKKKGNNRPYSPPKRGTAHA